MLSAFLCSFPFPASTLRVTKKNVLNEHTFEGPIGEQGKRNSDAFLPSRRHWPALAGREDLYSEPLKLRHERGWTFERHNQGVKQKRWLPSKDKNSSQFKVTRRWFYETRKNVLPTCAVVSSGTTRKEISEVNTGNAHQGLPGKERNLGSGLPVWFSCQWPVPERTEAMSDPFSCLSSALCSGISLPSKEDFAPTPGGPIGR